MIFVTIPTKYSKLAILFNFNSSVKMPNKLRRKIIRKHFRKQSKQLSNIESDVAFILVSTPSSKTTSLGEGSACKSSPMQKLLT